MLRCMILVAVGANLPDSAGRPAVETCRWAVERLAGLPGLELARCSRWYRSVPVPPSGQPDYVNGVVRLRGAADPDQLLQALHGIEAEAGRVRTTPNAARPLDLDLLAIDQLVYQSRSLVLPHPRLQDRAFVLAPLCDVALDWVHPTLGPARALLAAADLSGLSLLDEPGTAALQEQGVTPTYTPSS